MSVDIKEHCYSCKNIFFNPTSLVLIITDTRCKCEPVTKPWIFCVNFRIPYTGEDVGDLVSYLDSAKKCLCGSYCFESFVHYLYRLDLRRVATNLTAVDLSGRMHAPAEAFLCSQSCLERYQKNPYATIWPKKWAILVDSLCAWRNVGRGNL